jgi:hypothetical protein
MAVKHDLIQAALQDVKLTGSARLNRKKLLWMIGRQNDSASAWGILLDEWEEIGGDRKALQGLWFGEYVTLLHSASEQISKLWAKE